MGDFIFSPDSMRNGTDDPYGNPHDPLRRFARWATGLFKSDGTRPPPSPSLPKRGRTATDVERYVNIIRSSSLSPEEKWRKIEALGLSARELPAVIQQAIDQGLVKSDEITAALQTGDTAEGPQTTPKTKTTTTGATERTPASGSWSSGQERPGFDYPDDLSPSAAQPRDVRYDVENENPATMRVQEALIKLGFLPEGEADGYFGKKTEAAVKEFLARYTSDGKGYTREGGLDDRYVKMLLTEAFR